MTENSLKHVATLGNSIIGVSVLAMPFCFQQCGIVLGILMLVASAFVTRFNCHLLLKAALISRRKTFELLAFHAFGFHGKLAVETSIICFLLGILISFYVVIGDITPGIIGELLNIENNSSLRTLILTAVGLGVALPLGLLKNINSLGNISALSLCFYAILIFKIFSDALPILLSERWWDNVIFWQPRGILQCLPIFALAVSCQTQIFEIYDSMSEPSLGKMNRIIKLAVYFCVFVYVSVGFFGYIALVNKDFSGNVLVNMPSTFLTEFIKLGFVLSVALSFPLVIFPCRTSLCSLLSKKAYTGLDVGSNYIPEVRFRTITISVVVVTLIMGILCPNIELVLGLVGSTIGTVICIIFPAILFIRVTNKNTFERFGAQVVFGAGLFLLIACTHVTIHKADQELLPDSVPDTVVPDANLGRQDVPLVVIEQQDKLIIPEKVLKVDEIYEPPKIEKPVTITYELKDANVHKPNEQRRLEPPIPQEPDSISNNKEKAKAEREEKILEQERANKVLERENKEIKVERLPLDVKATDATVKDDKEQIATKFPKTKDVDLKQEELLKKLESQQKEQAKLIEAQKHLLEELKAHKESHHVLKDAEVPEEPKEGDGDVHETVANSKVYVPVTNRPIKLESPPASETILKIPEPKEVIMKRDFVPKEFPKTVEVLNNVQQQQSNVSNKDTKVKSIVEHIVIEDLLKQASKNLGSQEMKRGKVNLKAENVIRQDGSHIDGNKEKLDEQPLKILRRDTESVLGNHPIPPNQQHPVAATNRSNSQNQPIPKSSTRNDTEGAQESQVSLLVDNEHKDVPNVDSAKLSVVSALPKDVNSQQKQNAEPVSPNVWRKDEQR